MFSKKEISELNKQLAELKERLDALESSVAIYPTKGVLGYLPTPAPINQVVKAIVNHLELDILAIQPTHKKVELKPKQVSPTISTGVLAGDQPTTNLPIGGHYLNKGEMK